jgi:predicted HAD superfamily Cof-like phosphohydrolase
MKSDYNLVKEFTEGTGNLCPTSPSVMSKEQTFFLSKMILDEVMEFMACVCGPEESKSVLKSFINESKDIPQEDYTNDDNFNSQQISDQGDALVDSYYYSLNAACKAGIDLSSIFKVVHKANMDKKDPKTGKFIKREDGKILKPPNWQPPDIVAEIKRQLEDTT